jgi:hypothetical protein
VGLRRVLLIGDEDLRRFDYLQPMLKLGNTPDGITIVSLNYDLSIEGQASRIGVALDDGFDVLNADRKKDWPETGVRLLKLHGSIGWSQPVQSITTGQIARFPFERSPDPPNDNDTPALIFGRGNKMRPAGLFLHLYVSFLEQLAAAKRLVLVGYWFRDAHINQAIGNWLERDTDTRVHIIDPRLPDLTRPAFQWPDTTSESHHGMMSALGPIVNASGNMNYVMPADRVSGAALGAAAGLCSLLSP